MIWKCIVELDIVWRLVELIIYRNLKFYCVIFIKSVSVFSFLSVFSVFKWRDIY